jgi:hypothetical protein
MKQPMYPGTRKEGLGRAGFSNELISLLLSSPVIGNSSQRPATKNQKIDQAGSRFGRGILGRYPSFETINLRVEVAERDRPVSGLRPPSERRKHRINIRHHNSFALGGFGGAR